MLYVTVYSFWDHYVSSEGKVVRFKKMFESYNEAESAADASGLLVKIQAERLALGTLLNELVKHREQEALAILNKQER